MYTHTHDYSIHTYNATVEEQYARRRLERLCRDCDTGTPFASVASLAAAILSATGLDRFLNA
jgi:hypothetical protein